MYLSAGYNTYVYGARPIKRVVQRELESALARKLLAGEIEEGAAVEVGVRASELVLKPKAVRVGQPKVIANWHLSTETYGNVQREEMKR